MGIPHNVSKVYLELGVLLSGRVPACLAHNLTQKKGYRQEKGHVVMNGLSVQ